jgi:hypothetical protein
VHSPKKNVTRRVLKCPAIKNDNIGRDGNAIFSDLIIVCGMYVSNYNTVPIPKY